MNLLKEIGRLSLVLLLQVLLFDHLHIGNWGVVMVYILFLINLPVRIPRWTEMFIGFFVGLLMDIWHSSMGVHIAACVALCFARPLLLKNAVQDIERIKNNLSSQNIGIFEYAKCAIILTTLHHFIVFSLEMWNIHFWWMILLQTIISSIMTLTVIWGYERLKTIT